jgi:hypothetical protein
MGAGMYDPISGARLTAEGFADNAVGVLTFSLP